MIDERAIIHPSAKLADDVTVGPWTIIGADVEIGPGSWVGPHVVIKGPTRIGRNNRIYQFASVGEDPQDMKYQGEKTELIIGDNNVIREFCTLNRGTVQGGGATRMGDRNLLMAYVHIAHDCVVGNDTIFSNNASIAGHVIVDDHAILGGFSVVHQYCRIGAYAFLSKASVNMDVLPFIIVQEREAGGINTVGLKRHGFSNDVVNELRKAYKVIFRQGHTIQQAIEKLTEMAENFSEIQLLIDSLKASTRGIQR